ncbi:MAG: hypothetical protein K6F09_01695 [Clostridiales bacterium]|nr:hypothetical protein [Clostridiales bacterium]
MKNIFKRAISVLLSVAIILSAFCFSASATSEAPAETAAAVSNVTPAIVVPGIGMSKVTFFDENGNPIKDENGEMETWTVFNLYTDEIMDNLWRIIPRFLLSLLLQCDVGLTSALKKYMPSLFKYAAHDLKGEPIEKNVAPLTYKFPVSQFDEDAKGYFYRSLPIQKYADKIGEDNLYVFNYMAFSNTYEEADNLREFIQLVKQQTGSPKVTLLPVSLGGTVANAYFDKYSSDNDVASVVNVVAALNGSDMVADILDEAYADDADKLLYGELLPEMIGEDTGYLVNIALRLLPRKLTRKIVDTAMGVVIETVIRNTPSFWALVPPDRYEKLADKYLSDSDHAYIRSLTDRYHNAQKNVANKVKELTEERGVNIFNICGCDLEFGKGWTDYQYFRFFKSAKGSNADGIIQISSTGMGTDSVPAGEKYPADRTPAGTICCNDPSHNHIYASVNASTCYLPERTWYFVGQHHEIAYNDVAVGLVCKLILGEISDIYSDPGYPQFNGSRNTKKIVRDYIPDMQKADLSKLTPEQREKLEKAAKAANDMMENTTADAAECDRITKDFYDALVECGIYTEEQPSKSDKFKTKMLKAISDFLNNKCGQRGFSDILLFRKY